MYDICCRLSLNYPKRILYVISISILFCQLFVVIILAIDIFYFHKFNYFYKSLILLLYPLTMKGLLYALKDYAEEGFSEMEKFAICEFDAIKEEWSIFWREDMLDYYDQDNFNRLVIAYTS